jgi:hypothetical protein
MVDYVATVYARIDPVDEYSDLYDIDAGDLAPIHVRGHPVEADAIPAYASTYHVFTAPHDATKDELRDRTRDDIDPGDLTDVQVREVKRD